MSYFFGLLIFFCLTFFCRLSPATQNGFCKDFQLSQIPLGSWSANAMPQDQMRITQEYNTSKAEGYCMVGGAQPSGDSSACTGQKIYYGHDGLDLHPLGAPAGKENVYSVQPGLVVASHSSGSFQGWGESMIIATRTNQYSEEVLTFHYHHLHFDGKNGLTTRLFSPCEQVQKGAVIAKEGGTPEWPTHLHLSVKRWINAQELLQNIKNSPGLVYGYGYSFGDNGKLAKNLDPQGLLYNYFEEFTGEKSSYTTWQWSQSYAQEMRVQGWYFGEFDGKFGVDKTVPRRLAARLFKQALNLSTPSQFYGGGGPWFWDVPVSDPDYVYVNALISQPLQVKVINPDATCLSGGKYFCPDKELTRAEALKMVVAGFFQDEFLEVYNNWIWQAAAPLASNLLSNFADVSPYSWYAPYVYFAWKKGLTGGGAMFNPNLSIRRAELGKWLIMSGQLKGGDQGYCHFISCLGSYYCDNLAKTCLAIPKCIPTENLTCPLGGGYSGSGSNNPGNTSGSNSTPGSSSGGTGGTYNSDNSSGGGGFESASGNGGVSNGSSSGGNFACAPGQEELKLCPNAQGATYRVCQSSGQWTAWNPPCFDNSTGNGGAYTEIGGNGGSFNSAGYGGSPSQNTGGDTGSGGSEGYTSTGGYDGVGAASGSGGTTGATSSGGSSTSGGCTPLYSLSPSGASCYSNPAASGSPTLCLETKFSGTAQVSWRLCKQGGFFSKDFTYELLDQNHLSQYLGGQKKGSAGDTCTIWQKSDFSYINQNGPINGAGLRIEVHSPQGCALSGCTYYTGITTLSRQCQ